MRQLTTVAGIYLGVGACLLGAQLTLAGTGNPMCLYGVRQTLLERTFPPKPSQVEELMATLRGEPRRSNVLAVSRHVVGWLPDVFSHVIDGPMTMREFLEGGTTCVGLDQAAETGSGRTRTPRE
jgi:hypothetical protein